MTTESHAQEWARVLANHDAAVQRVNDTLAIFRTQLAQAGSSLGPKIKARSTHADVALIVAATEQHCLVSGQPDADGHDPCSCGQWREGADGSSWDEHMAEVTVAALAAAGRLA